MQSSDRRRQAQLGAQHEAVVLMRDTLGSEYTQLRAGVIVVEENVQEGATTIRCDVVREGSGEEIAIEGRGVGLIDALFAAFISRFAEDYPSLKTLRFHSFDVHGQIDVQKNLSGATPSRGATSMGSASGSDAPAVAQLEIANSEGAVFSFSGSSRSIISSTVSTIVAGLEYFINSERTFLTIYRALQDARARNREDLVQRYTNSMATLVRNTSYSEVISQIQINVEE